MQIFKLKQRRTLKMSVFLCIILLITLFHPIAAFAQLLPNHLHSSTEQYGVHWDLDYNSEVFSNLAGGNQTKTAFQGYLDLGIHLDLEKIVGLNRTSIDFNIINLHGKSPSSFVGDDLLVSNIDGAKTTRLQQFYVNYQSANNKLEIKAGLLAADEDFLTTSGSTLFLHMPAGYSYTLSLNAPPWPVASTALQIRYDLTEQWTLRLAGFDADADNLDEFGTNSHGFSFTLQPANAFLIAEAVWEGSLGGANGFYRLGTWHDTNTFPTISGNLKRGLTSIYMAADQQIYSKTKRKDDGLYLFALAGWVFQDERASYDYDIHTGAYWKGLISNWDDSLGFIFNYPHVSDLVVVSNLPGQTQTESFLELTYQTTIMDGLSIQGSVLHVINPGGASARQLDNATVLGIRSTFSF